MEETLFALEEKLRDSLILEVGGDISGKIDFFPEPGELAALFTFADTEDNLSLSLGLGIGYIKGKTAYDFNHHTSELEFPMDNVMMGTDFSLGFKNLTLYAEFWTSLEDYAGFNMKDKDWNASGDLISYTKSKAYMDAIIADANLRYDFYKKALSRDITKPILLAGDEIKIGVLLGYRFERFDYDMYDVWNQLTGTTTYQGVKALTYKIKYYLPYLGLAMDLSRQNFGFGMNIKGSFYATAEDVDNHLLRGLTFYADYDKNGEALMGSIYGFFKFTKNWKLKVAADGTFIRIDGRTWEESRDPAWNTDQSTDLRHWIFWSGIEYRF